MTALRAAIALAVASAAAYAVASVLQERVAASQPTTGGAGPPAGLDFLIRPRWWLAVWLNGAGAALHVAALAYGSLSVVQPLGVLTLVLALPLGAATGGRRTSGRQWWGAGATVLGLGAFLLLTALGETGGGNGLTTPQGALVSAVAGAAVLGLAVAARATRRPLTRCLLAACAAGVAFATASALTQSVTEQTRATGVSALLSPLALVLVAMAVGGLLLSQFAYRNSGLGAPLAALTLANPVASTAIGVLVLGDRTTGGRWGALAAVLGAAGATAGVILLAEPRRARSHHGPPHRPAPARHPGDPRRRRPTHAGSGRAPAQSGGDPTEASTPSRRPAGIRCPGRRIPAISRRRTFLR